jgi:hypothetical protein
VVAQGTYVETLEGEGRERSRSKRLAWKADGGLLDRTESAAFLQKDWRQERSSGDLADSAQTVSQRGGWCSGAATRGQIGAFDSRKRHRRSGSVGKRSSEQK